MAEQKARRACRLEGLGRDAPRTRSGSTSPRSSAAPSFIGYSHGRRARARCVALVKDGQRSGSASGARRRSTSSPTRHPSMARAAARWAMPASISGDKGLRGRSDGHAEAARAPPGPPGLMIEAGDIAVGDAVRLTRRPWAARRDPRQPFGDPSAARGAAPAARRCMSRRRAASSPPTACASTSRSQTAIEPVRIAEVEAEVNRHIRENGEVCDAADDPAGSDHRRRDGAVRREIWRRSPRRLDGPRGRQAPIRSSCAAARMSQQLGDIALFKIVISERGIERASGASKR